MRSRTISNKNRSRAIDFNSIKRFCNMAICQEKAGSSLNVAGKRRRPSDESVATTAWIDDSLNSQASFQRALCKGPKPHYILRRVSTDSSQVTKSVCFSSIEIHEHCYTMGDNPSVAGGPPLSMEWKSFRTVSFALDDYEQRKPEPRTRDTMVVPRSVREEILRREGFSRGEMKEAANEAEKIRQQRVKSSRDGQVLRQLEKWTKRLKKGRKHEAEHKIVM